MIELEAINRYTGGYWDKKSTYMDVKGDEGAIISAEYGILRPTEKIPYYNTTIDDLKDEPINREIEYNLPTETSIQTELDAWAAKVLTQLQEWINEHDEPNTISLEIVLGKTYLSPLQQRNIFTTLTETVESDLNITFTLQECIDYGEKGGIGKQLEWLSKQAKEEDDTKDNTSITDF